MHGPPISLTTHHILFPGGVVHTRVRSDVPIVHPITMNNNPAIPTNRGRHQHLVNYPLFFRQPARAASSAASLIQISCYPEPVAFPYSSLIRRLGRPTMLSDRAIPATPSPSAVSMETLRFLGSTSIFFRARQGIVLKAPAKILEDQVVRERPSVARHYLVERQILDRLGEHPRVVRCDEQSLENENVNANIVTDAWDGRLSFRPGCFLLRPVMAVSSAFSRAKTTTYLCISERNGFDKPSNLSPIFIV